MPKKKLTLKVVFDTNAIFTRSESDLFKKDVGEIITTYSKINDIEISWFLPEIVLKERIFQMTKRGNELLPAIQKLEKLFGHGLNINKELIELRVNEAVKKQAEKYSIKTILINPAKIKWEEIIQNSLFRLPPFEDNDKEKGFRDALILECLNHLIEDSPSTKSICRIVFITNDNLIAEAAREKTKGFKNINIYADLDELASFINVLSSEITEELINQISPEANSLFFIKEDKTTLYYNEEIRKKISEDFKNELGTIPEGAEIRENATWWINKPGFEKKEKQKIFWKTIIEVEFDGFKNILDVNTPQSSTILPEILKSQGLLSHGIPRYQIKKEKMGNGRTRFEVYWTAILTSTNKLRTPKLESFKFLDEFYK